MAGNVTLSVWDYIVFGLMLVLSSAVSLYYGYKGKQKSTKEYLTASGSMHWMPISISLMATFLSAIALMGMPSEVYTYGVQYFVSYFSVIAMVLSSALIYAPIFYKTQVTSANEVRAIRRVDRAVESQCGPRGISLHRAQGSNQVFHRRKLLRAPEL